MTIKDFSAWHERKTFLNNRVVRNLYFREQEIWWASVGLNIGYEEDGKGVNFVRPILILCKFNQNFFYGVPLSTTAKNGLYYHHFTYLTGTDSVALLTQVRAFDARRLMDRQGECKYEDYVVIRRKVAELFLVGV